MRKFAIALGIVAATAGIAVAALQDGMGGKEQEEHQGFQPGKEHAYLKQFEGTWDATGKWWMAPGTDPMTSTGTETAKLSLNGLWLIFDFDGEMMGGKFQGHGCQGYDPVKKKYVMTWVDGMDPKLNVGEGTLDASGKTLTMDVEGRDHETQKPTKDRWVSEMKDKDTYTFTLSRANPEGQYTRMGEITYKRKK